MKTGAAIAMDMVQNLPANTTTGAFDAMICKLDALPCRARGRMSCADAEGSQVVEWGAGNRSAAMAGNLVQ